MINYEQDQEEELYRSYYADLSAEARREDTFWRQIAEETAEKHWTLPT